MKRRTFFGFMGGAAVAAPAALKRTAEELAGLSIGRPLSAGMGGFGGLSSGGAPQDASSMALGLTRERNLLKLLGGLTAAQRQRLRQETWVDRLDPDLASYASFSLSAKISMQRDRNLEARLAHRRNWLERVLESGSYDDDLANI